MSLTIHFKAPESAEDQPEVQAEQEERAKIAARAEEIVRAICSQYYLGDINEETFIKILTDSVKKLMSRNKEGQIVPTEEYFNSYLKEKIEFRLTERNAEIVESAKAQFNTEGIDDDFINWMDFIITKQVSKHRKEKNYKNNLLKFAMTASRYLIAFYKDPEKRTSGQIVDLALHLRYYDAMKSSGKFPSLTNKDKRQAIADVEEYRRRKYHGNLINFAKINLRYLTQVKQHESSDVPNNSYLPHLKNYKKKKAPDTIIEQGVKRIKPHKIRQ